MAENDHKKGEMDITDQEKTFGGFMKMSMYVAILAIGIVLFLAVFAR